MSSPIASDRARVVRWPAILLLAAAIVLMAVVQRDATPAVTGDGAGLERPVVPTAGRAEALSSTWYCAAGTVQEEGPADHVIIVGNPSGRTAEVELTSHAVLAPEPIVIDVEAENLDTDVGLTPPEAVDLGTTATSVSVPPRSVERFRLADLGVAGEHAAVLVESDIGDLVVEHQISGPSGAGLAPCASASAQEWHFAAGTTREGARQTLSVFNPFPDDAVVDLTFIADGRTRAPQIYNGLVVPSGTVLPIDITDVVTLFDVVSTEVQVRTGRVVVDRTLSVIDADGAPAGLSLAAGAMAPMPLWVFPSPAPDGAVDVIVITNPSDTEAEVDVEVRLDVPEVNGIVEPIGLAIRPGRSEIVVLTQGAEAVSASRVFDASSRILDDVGYWVTVRSLRGTPVVAEHLTIPANAEVVAFSASPGLPVAASEHVFTTGDGGGEVSIVNPASDRIVRVEVQLLRDGMQFSTVDLEIAETGRQVLDLTALGFPADALVRLVATDPVMVERRVALTGSGSVTVPSLPVAGTTAEPIIPFG